MYWEDSEDDGSDGIIIVGANRRIKLEGTSNDSLTNAVKMISDLNASDLTIGKVLCLYDSYQDSKLLLLLLNEKVGACIYPMKLLSLSQILVNIYEAVLRYLSRTHETLSVNYDIQPAVSRNLKLIHIAHNKTVQALNQTNSKCYQYGVNMYQDCHVNILLTYLDPFTKQQLCNCLHAMSTAHQLPSIRGTETVSNSELYYPHAAAMMARWKADNSYWPTPSDMLPFLLQLVPVRAVAAERDSALEDSQRMQLFEHTILRRWLAENDVFVQWLRT